MESNTNNHLIFTELNIESYCGIDKTDSLVLVFPEDNARIFEFKGDQATKKTSSLNCIKALLGAEEVDNAINTVDKTKKASLVIKRPDGSTIISKLTKTSFSVILEDANGIKSTINSPKQFLRNLIGPIGLSPMDLKVKSGKEQILWLKEMFNFTDEHKKIEKQIAEGKKKSYDTRRDINRDISNRKTLLLNSKMYEWDEDNKCPIPTNKNKENKQRFSIPIDQKQLDIKERYQKLSSQKINLDNARLKVENYQSHIQANDKRIAALLNEIEQLKSENIQYSKSIEDGLVYISGIESCELELPKVVQEMQEMSSVVTEYNNYQNIVKIYEEYNKLDQASLELTSKIEAYNSQYGELIKIITPEIEGLEVCIPSSIDDQESDNREGIFYFGKSMQELSESELVGLYINIKKALNAKVDIIENISSLGSEAIKAINQFIEEGGTVFYSIMDRNEKKLQVSFYENIK